MKRRKVVSIVFAALLLVGVCGISFAQNATQVKVAISYPCDKAAPECNASEAVSGFAAGTGDKVNVYISLLDEAGTPAAKGPEGESLDKLDASIFCQRCKDGTMDGGSFAAAQTICEFNGQSVCRANIDYTKALPGEDVVSAAVGDLIGTAKVNIVGPDADALFVRTLGSIPAPAAIYAAIPGQINNDDNTVRAGNAVKVTVIGALDAYDVYTTAPNLEGKTVTVKAYANNNEDATVGPPGDTPNMEKIAIAEGTATFSNGIATVDLIIERGGPNPGALDVYFTAKTTYEDEQGITRIIQTTQMGAAGIATGDLLVDSVKMLSLPTASALVIGTDVYAATAGAGNLIMMDDCIGVLDDNTTARNVTVIHVDSFGNAVLATTPVTLTSNLDCVEAIPTNNCGAMDEQLHDLVCVDNIISAGAYSEACTLRDQNAAAAIARLRDVLEVKADNLTSASASLHLIPAQAVGTPDLVVNIDKASENITAGGKIVLTVKTVDGATNDILPLQVNDQISITADSAAGAQLLSSVDFASADTTLDTSFSDADTKLAGFQIPLFIYGPCTEGDENVSVTVTDGCGLNVDASVPIGDLNPDVPGRLAIVASQPTDSALDEFDPNKYVGTDPIQLIDPFVVSKDPENPIENVFAASVGVCSMQSWDQYNNSIDVVPTVPITCTTNSKLGIIVHDPATCLWTVKYPEAAIGTSDTIICELAAEDAAGDTPRKFAFDIVSELGTNQATAIQVIPEGPQKEDGEQYADTTIPVGEALIDIRPNGYLLNAIGVQITFETDLAGAELRDRDGVKRNLPFTVALDATTPAGNDVERFVVYAPGPGTVKVVVKDQSNKPLTQGELTLRFFSSPCEGQVSIAPASASTTPGGTVQFTATSPSGAGCNPGVYTWGVSASDCTSKGTIDEDGKYSAPDAGGCTETVKVTDTANGGLTAEATVKICGAIAVSVTCTSTDLGDGDTTTCTAKTTCDGTEVPGDFKWDIAGTEVGTGTTYTFACNAANEGEKTLKVTDNNNGKSATTAITCTICSIDVDKDQLARARFFPLLYTLIITCKGDDCDFKLGTRADFEVDPPLAVIPAGRFVFKNTQTILQLVLLPPALFAGGLDEEPVKVTVKVTNGGCDDSDTFDLVLLGSGQ